MNRLNYYILTSILFCLLFANSTLLHCQIKLDSVQYSRLIEDSQFAYIKENREQTNIIERLLDYISRFINKVLNETLGLSNTSLGIILISVIVIVILYFIYRANRKKVSPENTFMSDDFYKYFDIEEEGLRERIEIAVAKKDYRSAIRFTYILTLKTLGENQKIYWSEFRSNEYYHNQIRHESYADEFKKLLNLYEYFWYGEHQAKEAHYLESEQIINQVKEALNDV